VVATGGLAGAVAPLSDAITAVDADLTLRGTHLICASAAGPGGLPA
jgi:pantothenate kinase type III